MTRLRTITVLFILAGSAGESEKSELHGVNLQDFLRSDMPIQNYNSLAYHLSLSLSPSVSLSLSLF